MNGFLFDGGRFELVVTVQQEVRQTPMAICTSRKSPLTGRERFTDPAEYLSLTSGR